MAQAALPPRTVGEGKEQTSSVAQAPPVAPRTVAEPSDAQFAAGSGSRAIPEVYLVAEDGEGERLDAFLAGAASPSRSFLQGLIREGHVQVNGRKAKVAQRLRSGDRITVVMPPPRENTLAAEALPLEIVYEDEVLLVVNKPKGMVVHPSAGHQRGTLVNALLSRLGDVSCVGGALRPGIVHRLDKDTSGLLMVAKNDEVHLCLSDQIKKRTVKREYLALVHGVPSPDEGLLEGGIGRHPTKRARMAVVEGGRPAATAFQVEERFAAYALLRLTLRSGRTHQIRVHLEAWGFPVVGDPLYARRENNLGLTGQALHAQRLAFDHPTTGQRLEFEAPPPEDFRVALEELRRST